MEDLIKTLLNTSTLYLVPIVLIVINQLLIKVVGMANRSAIIVNFILAIPFTILATWGELDLFKAVLIGILLAAASSGIYDIKKLFV